jgi:hypothetical protein
MRFRHVGSGRTEKWYIDGKEVAASLYEAKMQEAIDGLPKIAEGVKGTSLTGWTPYYSEALAYHPKQIAQARDFLASRGVPTEIDAKGRPRMDSREHRKQIMKLNGFHDNDGGYGDG